MYRDGYRDITNIDYSQVVIDNMKERSEAARSMRWLVMDIRSLRFDRASFDVVIEKATLDALLVHERDPWHISDESLRLMDAILSQVRCDCYACLTRLTALFSRRRRRPGERRARGRRALRVGHVRPAAFSQATVREDALQLGRELRDVRRRLPLFLVRHDQGPGAVGWRCAFRARRPRNRRRTAHHADARRPAGRRLFERY